ncbi:chromosome segregation protein SMC [Halorhodospira halochloris]|uniref:chromosome segregation protein SMC n=1 Tax=Halorhodospira halochloris TaxID=1052 RepID=UPI001EE7A03A|nr:chromosome segregation protein SMC [Halorhodospira halochloris]MCG5529845.1 chromosome segregation protein SMC [Halorhodospira halochloris]
MQLKRIKLAGFKSFVDPTPVPLPGRMVGVVGPNGCGKSNIIDAVRWVMGESSAKHLRGESMTDVIFNGSSERAPVSKASIELLFDNSDGAIGGKYSAFNEISVKRQVNREGQSQYLLNGTRCRRRDISEVFLGTGLRPRGYTIIEQGMISRVIESRPEELRVYLEEAAGISVYKERRRETERRIRDTRENLERLDDVRDEVYKQLEKLRRQAEVAEKYRRYRAEERQLRAELSLLRRRRLDQRIEALEQTLADLENQRQSAVAEQRHAENEIETLRDNLSQRNDELNKLQGQYYETGAQLASLEEKINSTRELRQRREQELEQTREALSELEGDSDQDQQRLSELREQLAELEPLLEATEEEEHAADAEQQQARRDLDAWRDRAESQRAEQQAAQRREEVERTRYEAAARRVEELAERITRLDSEQQGLDIQALEEEIGELEAQSEALEQDLESLQEQRDSAAGELEQLIAQRDAVAADLEQAREAVSDIRARLTSLETLQEAALGRDGGELREWLEQQGWGDAPRLAERLQVDSRWAQALEVVLAEMLQGVCVEHNEITSSELVEKALAGQGESQDQEQSQGPGVILISCAEQQSRANEEGVGSGYLLEHVSGAAVLSELLAGVRCAASLEQALHQRSELREGESIVTPDGVWLGSDWLRTPAVGQPESGVLEREQQMQQLRAELEAAEERLAELTEKLAAARDGVSQAQAQRDEKAAELGPLNRRQAELAARLEQRREQLERAEQRRAELADERQRLIAQQSSAQSECAEADQAAQKAAEEAAQTGARLEELEVEREQLRDNLEQAAERLRSARERRHDLSMQRQQAQTALDSLSKQLDKAAEQRERLMKQSDELAAALAEEDSPVDELRAKRESLLEQRSQLESELQQLRRDSEELDRRLREQDRQRLEAEQRAESLREQLESQRLELGELRVHRSHEETALAELGEDEQDIEQRLPSDAEDIDISAWDDALEKTAERIRRLGSVNLAAIDECEQLEERRSYLDQQYNDLTEALETLESAIRRIDRETRSRFRETFEQVNQELGKLFPRLFGGGRAYLELTDDDLLSTGVVVLAQPPGKRITNIHMLSGGEKALTAVALVFAIFNLNPAPFCLLDEVDAPLDEANVGRFCDLVAEMSERVQFILITHNRTTMERVSHLLGVTMNEPGVSRLVAVDVKEAAEMAGA